MKLTRVVMIVLGMLAVVFALMIPAHEPDEIGIIVLGSALVAWAVGGLLTA